MNEYNNFLNHFLKKEDDDKNSIPFNKKENAEKPSAAQGETQLLSEEDRPAVGETQLLSEEDKPAAVGETQLLSEEDKPAAVGETQLLSEEDRKAAPDGKSAFIKNKNTQYVSVRGGETDQPNVDKYTDRFKKTKKSGKKHTGYTGKLNTYAANHAPEDNGSNFKTVSEEEKLSSAVIPSKKDTPERSAVNQQRIVPETVTPGKTELKAEPETKKVPAGGIDYFNIKDTAPVNATPEKALHATDTPVQQTESPAQQAQPPVNKEKTKVITGDAKGSLLRALANDGGAETEEDVLEEEVQKNRSKRIDDFNFWNNTQNTGETKDESFRLIKEKKTLPEAIDSVAKKFSKFDGNFLKVKCDPFRDFNHHRPVFKALMDLRKNTLIKAGITGGIGFILLLINIITSVSAAMNNGFFTVFGGNAKAYVTVNLIFLIIASVIMADDLISGLFSFLQAKPKTDTALLFMTVSGFIQIIGSYITAQNIEQDYHMLTGGIILLCAPILISKSFYYDSIRHCFKTVAAKSEKSYLRKIDGEELGTSSPNGEKPNKNTVYPGKTRFIADFIEKSGNCAERGQVSSRFVLIAIGVCIFTGLVTLIAKRNFMMSLTAMCFSSALSMPIGCALFTGFIMSNENKALSVKSCFINSFDDAEDVSKIDELIVSDTDIFKAEITDAVSYSRASAEQAALVAASIVAGTGSILEAPLKALSNADTSKFPKAEDLTYEDKLGFSAWTSGCKVLLGSKAFLTNHNVKLPEDNEAPDKRYIYLAIEGQPAARFTVCYSPATESVKRIRLLAQHGTNILLAGQDPNLTDAYAESLLLLPPDSVRTISRKAALRINQEKETVTDGETVGTVFNNSFDSLCRCVYSALKLTNAKKLAALICEICSGLGLAVGFILAVTGSGMTSPWLCVIMQIIWMAMCFLLTPLLSPIKSDGSDRATVRPVGVTGPYTPDNYAQNANGQYDPQANDVQAAPETEESYEEEYAEEEYTEEQYEGPADNGYDGSSPVYVELPEIDDLSGFSLKGRTVQSAPTYQAPQQNTANSRGLFKKKANAENREQHGQYAENGEAPAFRTSSTPAAPKRSILSFAEEEMPAPPKYDLNKDDDLSFLDVKFEPPFEAQEPSGTVFDDNFFSKYDSDNIFSGLKDGDTKKFKF